MHEIVTHSPSETELLGVRWGEEAQAGWVFGLKGELGAGKTQLVKGIAKGLGIRSRVLSPTFALIHQYTDGRVPLYHLDLYRLEGDAQIRGAGLEEYLFQRTGVTVVEWVDRWPEMGRTGSPENRFARHRSVTIEQIGELDRRIQYEDSGS
jgi:tRNA threonylcarbamoyladenosine biosynthesis protein TsaE